MDLFCLKDEVEFLSFGPGNTKGDSTKPNGKYQLSKKMLKIH